MACGPIACSWVRRLRLGKDTTTPPTIVFSAFLPFPSSSATSYSRQRHNYTYPAQTYRLTGKSIETRATTWRSRARFPFRKHLSPSGLPLSCRPYVSSLDAPCCVVSWIHYQPPPHTNTMDEAACALGEPVNRLLLQHPQGREPKKIASTTFPLPHAGHYSRPTWKITLSQETRLLASANNACRSL